MSKLLQYGVSHFYVLFNTPFCLKTSGNLDEWKAKRKTAAWVTHHQTRKGFDSCEGRDPALHPLHFGINGLLSLCGMKTVTILPPTLPHGRAKLAIESQVPSSADPGCTCLKGELVGFLLIPTTPQW